MIIPCDPLSDASFQSLFCKKENIDLSLNFLNAVFEAIGRPLVSSIELIKPLRLGKFSGEKTPPPEALYLDAEGRPIQLIMVKKKYPELCQGMLANWTTLYSHYVPACSPKDFPVYSIWLHCNAFPAVHDWLHTITMISDEPPGPPLKLFEDMCLVGIDVAGWPDRAKFSIENLDRRRRLDRWLSFLTLPPGDIPDPLLRTLENSWLDKAAAALGRRRGHRR